MDGELQTNFLLKSNRMRKLEINEFRGIIDNLLIINDDNKLEWKFDLTPSSIINRLYSMNLSFRIDDIEFWEDWESGLIDISNLDFLEFFLSDIGDKEQTIVCFDDCFKTGTVFTMIKSSLISLKENNPESTMSFLEPLDHIFFFPRLNRLILIHHEGKKVDISFSSRASM